MEYPILNKLQTPLVNLELEKEPKETQDQFDNFFFSVPLIQWMTSKNRPRAKDLQRSSDGKIIVDVTHPHILENMDYFRGPALHYQKTGKYTDLRPNPNPNSAFGKWLHEEKRRCYEGMVRPSDGEWIPGDLYFFWNYTPMQVSKDDRNKKKKSHRIVDFPSVWDGHYIKFHYLDQARNNGKHAVELASRGKGKSFAGAALMAKRFILGESWDVKKKVTCYATACNKGKLVNGDQTLDKFQYDIDFCAENTEFPRKRITNSLMNMMWTMGYQDLDSGTKKGTLNSVIGISSKDDESKLRGSRGVLYIIEEAGTFPRLLELWNNMLPSVEEGTKVYGLLFAYGTSGDSQSDFHAMAEMMYHPVGYHVYPVKNVYDIEGKGGKVFSFFFPGYLNYDSDCYDKDGNSDITKALLKILRDRFILKHNSTDINSITKKISNIPITPQEAIVRSSSNIFPITEINDRIMQLDNNPNTYDDVYIGMMDQEADGTVVFKDTNDEPIRNFPTKDNKLKGAVEIFSMPNTDKNGKIPYGRYILSCDPVDSDESDTLSLCSIFVLDLFTDTIVAEYTGRQMYAEQNYEILRRLCLYYNGSCLYENNLKGTYAYFKKLGCTDLLADTPEYLQDRDLLKVNKWGNTSKGVTATKPINDYANKLIRDWLLKPIPHIAEKDGEEVETMVFNLYRLRNRALLKELSLYNPEINVDRIRSLGLLMLYREAFFVESGGDIFGNVLDDDDNHSKDKFFERNNNII